MGGGWVKVDYVSRDLLGVKVGVEPLKEGGLARPSHACNRDQRWEDGDARSHIGLPQS